MSAAGFAKDAPDHVLPEGGTGRESISSGIYGRCTRSRTPWGWNKTTRASAAGFAEDAPDYVLPEGGTRPGEHQQRNLQKMQKITNSLRMEQGHKSVSSRICGRRTRSRTNCGWKKAARLSAAFTEDTPEHVQTVGGTRPRERQQRNCGRCRSCTSWEWNKAATASVAVFAEDAPDHIRTEGGARPRV